MTARQHVIYSQHDAGGEESVFFIFRVRLTGCAVRKHMMSVVPQADDWQGEVVFLAQDAQIGMFSKNPKY